MATGKIKNWIQNKGYGFIAGEVGVSGDIFFHINNSPELKNNERDIVQGKQVVFQTRPSQTKPGSFEAYNVCFQETGQQTIDSEASIDTPGDYFHNPYTFVPTPPREKAIENGGFAGDFNPLEHPRGKEHNLDHAFLKPNLWTGHIPIKITTVTPLVLLKSNGRKEDSTEPYDVYDHIPESSLRGVLRSAYEVVTNSRYGCFSNDEQLAYRMGTTEAVKLIPTIIKKNSTTGKLKACLYTGTTAPKSKGPTKPRQRVNATRAKKSTLYAAMLTCYKNGTPKTSLEGEYNEPKTGDKVYAEIILCDKPRYIYWKASRVWRKSDCSTKPSPGNVPSTWNNKVSLYKDLSGNPIIEVVEGTVLITNENIDKKHDERIFFCDNPIEKEIREDHEKAWKKLIKNYRDAHPDDDDIFNRKDINNKPKEPWEAFIKGRDEKNRNIYDYAWSPHLYHKRHKGERKDRWGRDVNDAIQLQDGTMAYARCKIDDKTGDIKEVLDLFPVMISRELYECSPKKLLDKSLRPAEKLDKLSPADRLFGWTPQGQGSDGGYKSRIRVVCEDSECPDILENFKDDPLPLTILGEPKPAQGRFYVAEDDQGTPQADGLSKEKAGYGEGKGLRGRKHYWHHKGLEEKNAPDYWKSPAEDRTRKETNGRFQEYRRPDKYNNQTQQMEKQTDTQNRSIKGWIKPNKKFKASLYVQNLQQKEVGALLWLLTLNKDLGEGDEKRYFKLGYGKPLGFGSMEIEIDTDRLKDGCLPLGTDEDWKTYYEKFDACPPAAMEKAKQEECRRTFMNSMVDAYEFLNQQTFEELPFIKGFLRVLQGPNKDYRIHYPRTNPKRDPDGKNYDWFVDNERGRSRKVAGRDEVGKRLPLPDVNSDGGLPYNPSEPRD